MSRLVHFLSNVFSFVIPAQVRISVATSRAVREVAVCAGMTGVFILACGMPTLTMAASFDCDKASSVREKTICANPELSKMDETLAISYNNAISLLSIEGKKILRDDQRRWLRYVDDVCFKYKNKHGGATCVEESYKKRIEDMKTAAIKIGPFLFSRIDYYYSSEDKGYGSPYAGYISYPRIDNPESDALKKWNAVMALNIKDYDEGLCDEQVNFEVKSATDTIISTQVSDAIYCHGAAHGNYGLSEKTYILTPELHRLNQSDIFSANKAWKNVLTERCYREIAKQAKEESGSEIDKTDLTKDFKNDVTNSNNWAVIREGLIISDNPCDCNATGTFAVTIPWKDLKPYLVPNAPIPH